jgi:hypothetical protein
MRKSTIDKRHAIIVEDDDWKEIKSRAAKAGKYVGTFIVDTILRPAPPPVRRGRIALPASVRKRLPYRRECEATASERLTQHPRLKVFSGQAVRLNADFTSKRSGRTYSVGHLFHAVGVNINGALVVKDNDGHLLRLSEKVALRMLDLESTTETEKL